MFELLVEVWNRLGEALKVRTPARKSLRVCENVSLGDKRFLALVQVGEERFLIGGASNSVALLARLSEASSFPSAIAGFSQGVSELQ